MRAIGAGDEHARRGIHGGNDAQVGRRPADSLDGLVQGFARDKCDVNLPGFDQRNILCAALGMARLHQKCRIRFIERFG